MKRLISLVLVAALSFFSFMVYAEEPFAPIYIMSTINLREGENYSFNGDGIATFEAGFNTSSGQQYGSFYFNRSTNAFNNNGSFSGVTGGYLRVGNMNGTYIFKKDQVYVIRMSFSFGGQNLDPTSLTFFDASWGRPYEVLSSSYDMLCFCPTEDFQLNRCTFNFSFPSSINLVQSSLGVRYLSVQSLVGFTRDSSSADIIAAIENQTQQDKDLYDETESKWQGAVNSGQAGANQEIQDNVGQLEDFDNQIFSDVTQHIGNLDFSLADWADAAAGITYIGSIFMLIWNNSPTQIIILSLMVGLCILLLGRGTRLAGEVRRSNERAERRKKGG